MSSDEDLEKIRQKRLAEMQAQAAAQQQGNEESAYAQRAQLEAQKQAIMAKILTSEARSRLANIRMARPEFAEQIEIQLIQLAQGGALRGKIPISDELFKNILVQLQQSAPKREGKIKFM